MRTNPESERVGLHRLKEELDQGKLELAVARARLAELQRGSSRSSTPNSQYCSNSTSSQSPHRNPTVDGNGFAAEWRWLLAKNAELRQALLRQRRAERTLALDPQLLEIRNKTAATQREVAQVTQEVRTLENVRRQWRRGMDRVRAGERSVSAIRGRQYEEQQQLRDTLRKLTEELRHLEKKDIQLHGQFAALQRQVMLNVTEKELKALKEEREEQERTIENLKKKRDELRSRQADLMDEHRRLAFKEGRAKAKMERDIAELKVLLQMRDRQLGQLHNGPGGGRERGRPHHTSSQRMVVK